MVYFWMFFNIDNVIRYWEEADFYLVGDFVYDIMWIIAEQITVFSLFNN